jgi:hypothetical protein
VIIDALEKAILAAKNREISLNKSSKEIASTIVQQLFVFKDEDLQDKLIEVREILKNVTII